MRRHRRGDTRIPSVIAMDERNHGEQRFASFLGVAGSSACIGSGGSYGQRLARASCIDDEPTGDYARGYLMQVCATRAGLVPLTLKYRMRYAT